MKDKYLYLICNSLKIKTLILLLLLYLNTGIHIPILGYMSSLLEYLCGHCIDSN